MWVNIIFGLVKLGWNSVVQSSNCSVRIAGDCPSPRHAAPRSNTVSKQSGVYPRLARTDRVASRLWGALAVPIIFVTGIAPKPIPASSPPRREVRSRGGGGGDGRSHRAPVRARGRLSHWSVPTKHLVFVVDVLKLKMRHVPSAYHGGWRAPGHGLNFIGIVTCLVTVSGLCIGVPMIHVNVDGVRSGVGRCISKSRSRWAIDRTSVAAATPAARVGVCLPWRLPVVCARLLVDHNTPHHHVLHSMVFVPTSVHFGQMRSSSLPLSILSPCNSLDLSTIAMVISYSL